MLISSICLLKWLNNMIIRKANLNDLYAIKEVYNIAVKHMNEEGNINQWNDYDSFETGVKKYINDECFYIVLLENEIVGFFALIYGIDKTYNNIRYGEWLNNNEYVTIHKIAVKYYQKNIASFILNYIINEIKSKNIKNIRIDTHKDNISMQTFLNKKEFIHCGEISITCNFNDLPSLREAYMKELK